MPSPNRPRSYTSVWLQRTPSESKPKYPPTTPEGSRTGQRAVGVGAHTMSGRAPSGRTRDPR
eukprot:8108222-Pyramimonas_sp.AAC.1